MEEKETLSEDLLNYIDNSEAIAKNQGLETIIRKIYEDETFLNENNYIKVNLPNTREKFRSGNGEGIWAVPYTKEDQKISDDNILRTTFKVIVLNDCIYYPFRYGVIIQVKIVNVDQRPILDKEWLDTHSKLREFYE